MLRTALKPKWLMLLGVAVLIVIAFYQLGNWQLGVARNKAAKEAAVEAGQRQPVPLDQVLRPHTAFHTKDDLRRVTVTGAYAAHGQVLVPDRYLAGQRGYWVVAPFVDSTSGATLPVLRGFVTGPDGIPAAPQGTLTLTGGLAPGESPPDHPVALPEGQLASIDISVLVNQWPGDLFNAFLFLTDEQAGATPVAAQAGLTRVPIPTVDPGLNWRNAAYAAQWWVFAAFALWMWWRMVKEDRRRELELAGGQ